MNQKAKEVWVGLFLVVGIVVICGMVLHYGKFRERFQKMYEFSVRFQNVGQIARGAPVIMSGVNIGKVRQITLERKEGTVLLTLAIWEGITVRRDARFTIKQSGLLGDLNVVVLPQSDDAPQIAPGQVVDGLEPTDIQDTLEQAARIVVTIKSAADNIESATRKLDRQVMNEQTLGELRLAISNLQVVASNATHLVGDVRGLVGDARGLVNRTTAGIDSTLENLGQFSTNLSLASAQAMGIIQENEEDIRTTVRNVRTSSERLNTMLANVESGKGTIGKLLVDESFHQELKRLITNLRRFGVLRYRDEPLPAETPEAQEPEPAGKRTPQTRSKPGGL